MIQTAYCHVINDDVTLLVDMEGAISSVVCPDYDPVGHVCRRKRRDLGDGPLAQLIDRSSEHRLAERGERCHFVA